MPASVVACNDCRGSSSYARTPTYRGFDYFYGFYSGFIDYWSKKYSGYTDLRENEDVVTSSSDLDSSYHSGYLFESKAEEVIKDHAKYHKHSPMFLYYSMQLVHFPFTPPNRFWKRCTSLHTYTDEMSYCGMNVMLDEAIANLTCTLEQAGLADNTIMIVASDNGGSSDSTRGTNVPFRGYKYDYYRGGLSVNAFIHSRLLPNSVRGTTYDGQMHVTGE
jgi:arylsulfatase A-like enzyme